MKFDWLVLFHFDWLKKRDAIESKNIVQFVNKSHC